MFSSHKAQFVAAKRKVAMRMGQAFDGVGRSLPALLVAVQPTVVAGTAPAARTISAVVLPMDEGASEVDACPFEVEQAQRGAAKAAAMASTIRELPSAGLATRSRHSSSEPLLRIAARISEVV